MWQRLANWCLTQNQPESDGHGYLRYGSACDWRWLTLGDAVEGGNWLETKPDGQRITHSYWRRVPPGLNTRVG